MSHLSSNCETLWPSWLVVAPEMSNDLYKHYATDPRKETTNTKIREIKMIFFQATHLFGKKTSWSLNPTPSFSWHLLPLHPTIIPNPFPHFLSPFEMACAEARQLRMMPGALRCHKVATIVHRIPSPASPLDVPSMTLGFSGSERKSAVAIWCNVHPARAATWHVWHVLFPTLAFSLSSPMGVCVEMLCKWYLQP